MDIENIASSWKGHRKFAEILVRILNPSITVELGVDYGYSAFCFANQNIGTVVGIDSFQGDEHTGFRSTYDFVKNVKKENNYNNLIILKSFFHDMAKIWANEIDILHIDGRHHYEDIKEDYTTWCKFVKDDGVILMHDTEVMSFGVKKFFDEINLPKFNFTHSFGLGVICKNTNVLEKILALT